MHAKKRPYFLVKEYNDFKKSEIEAVLSYVPERFEHAKLECMGMDASSTVMRGLGAMEGTKIRTLRTREQWSHESAVAENATGHIDSTCPRSGLRSLAQSALSRYLSGSTGTRDKGRASPAVPLRMRRWFGYRPLEPDGNVERRVNASSAMYEDNL